MRRHFVKLPRIFSWRTLLLSAFMLVCGSPVWAQTSRASLEAQRQKTLKDIEETASILRQNEASQSKSVQQLSLLGKQISQRQRLMSEIQQEVSDVDRDISRSNTTISRLEKELKTIREEYARHLRDYQKKQYSRQIWLYVFGADDMTQAYRRHKYFQQYTASRMADRKSVV